MATETTKKLNEEAMDFLSDEGYEVFETIELYASHLFGYTNFHDAMQMLNILKEKIEDVVYVQNDFLIVGDSENALIGNEIDRLLSDLEYEEEIWETE